MRLAVLLLASLGLLTGKEKAGPERGSLRRCPALVADRPLSAESPGSRGWLPPQKVGHSAALLHDDHYCYEKHSKSHNQPWTHHHQSWDCYGSSNKHEHCCTHWTYHGHSQSSSHHHQAWKCYHRSPHKQGHRYQPQILHQLPYPGTAAALAKS